LIHEEILSNNQTYIILYCSFCKQLGKTCNFAKGVSLSDVEKKRISEHNDSKIHHESDITLNPPKNPSKYYEPCKNKIRNSEFENIFHDIY